MLSDEELAAIQERHARRTALLQPIETLPKSAHTDVAALLDEHAALRDRLAAAGEILQLLYDEKDALLQRERAARAIIEQAAHGPVHQLGGAYVCGYCGQPYETGDLDDDLPARIPHTTECPVTQARAWLADRAEQRATEQETSHE